jgi:carbonic anhydrase/acetyltransferase-like protein (isoleucine patch superfamily)
MKLPNLEKSPDIHPSVYVDPSARINGDVTLAEGASVWFNASIRGDVHFITVGRRTNVQDNCALHTTHATHPLIIGADVVIGHGAVLHGCTVEGPALIGMGAILLDGCIVKRDVVVGAGSLVTEGKVMPAGHLVLGSPARPVRRLDAQEIEAVRNGWRNYADYVEAYRALGKFHGWADHPLRDR